MDLLLSIFHNRYLVILGVPLLLLLCGAFARKVVRGTPFEAKDFYLGIESTLAALSSALIYFFELTEMLTRASTPPAVLEKVSITACFVVVAFFSLLYVMATHQDWEKKTGKGQTFRLLVVSNAMGLGLMAFFILLVKGGF